MGGSRGRAERPEGAQGTGTQTSDRTPFFSDKMEPHGFADASLALAGADTPVLRRRGRAPPPPREAAEAETARQPGVLDPGQAPSHPT